MDVPTELIETKVEEVKEQIVAKIEEIVPKVEEKIAEVTGDAVVKAQTAVEDTTKKASDAVLAAVESNAVVQKVEALIESNPQAKAAVEKVGAALVKEVDGRMFTCWCFGWWWSLKITGQDPRKVPATPSPNTDVPLSPPSAQVPEWSPPKVAVLSS